MWLTWRSFGLYYITHFLLFSNVLCQFEQTTWVDQAGQHVYTSVPNAQVTETVTAPASAPTMVYNCRHQQIQRYDPRSLKSDRRMDAGNLQQRSKNRRSWFPESHPSIRQVWAARQREKGQYMSRHQHPRKSYTLEAVSHLSRGESAWRNIQTRRPFAPRTHCFSRPNKAENSLGCLRNRGS